MGMMSSLKKLKDAAYW